MKTEEERNLRESEWSKQISRYRLINSSSGYVPYLFFRAGHRSASDSIVVIDDIEENSGELN